MPLWRGLAALMCDVRCARSGADVETRIDKYVGHSPICLGIGADDRSSGTDREERPVFG